MAKFIAYTDGSSNNLSPYGESGAAYIILDEQGNEIKRMSKGFLHKTNNWCEEMAIVSAVSSVPDYSTIDIYTDSMIAIKVFTACNVRSLVNVCAKTYCEILEHRKVRFHWVKGHNGNKYNEECDKMANARMHEMREKYNIPVYSRKNSPKVKHRKTE